MPVKKAAGPPRAPRHRVSCRRFSKGCCQDVRDVMNRKFRRENRRYLREGLELAPRHGGEEE